MIAVGAVVAVVANLVQSTFYDGGLPAMPAIFLPAVAALVVGFALILLDVPFGLALVLAGVLVLRPAHAATGSRSHGPHVPVEDASHADPSTLRG